MIRYLSFDLQGVLSASAFSDYFWREELPRLYAKKHSMPLEQAKSALRARFTAMGAYDIRYYDDAFWGRQLNFQTHVILEAMPRQPVRNEQLLRFIQSQHLPAIILSTTTMTFIHYELGPEKRLFKHIDSCIDTLCTGGKTPQVYRSVAHGLGVQPKEILHIGDHPEMDVRNAQTAGVHALLYRENDAALCERILRAVQDA